MIRYEYRHRMYPQSEASSREAYRSFGEVLPKQTYQPVEEPVSQANTQYSAHP